MAIRINTNLASLNAQRQLSQTNAGLSKTLERLSSGLRINRAADDAAGLAVAEKIRTQVKGHTQALANAQDATNLIGTAESGMDQISNVLQRMRELSIQSASDTLVNEDRSKIQTEIEQLRDELTRIAESTEFNTRKLLDGSIAQATGKTAPSASIKQGFRMSSLTGSSSALTDFFKPINSATTTTTTFFDQGKIALIDQNIVGIDEFIPTLDTAFQVKVINYQTNATSPVTVALEVSNSANGVLYTLDPRDAASFTNQGGFEAVQLNPTTLRLLLPMVPPSGGNLEGNAIGFFEMDPTFLTLSDIGKTAVVQIIGQRDPVTSDQSLTFHVGANEGQFIKMGVQDMRAEALRLETLNLQGSDDNDSRLKAQNAIGAIDEALDYVNLNRARIGAYQNRIENTIQNLQVSRENLQQSESRIRDADIAAETANLTRSQILVQAGTAVLTQANVSTQSALRLFR